MPGCYKFEVTYNPTINEQKLPKTILKIKIVPQNIMILRVWSTQTNHSVLIKYLYDNCRWKLSDVVDASKDDNFIKDEHLVPGWTQRLIDHLRTETLVGEYNPSKRVGLTRVIGADQSASLVDVGPQLEALAS